MIVAVDCKHDREPEACFGGSNGNREHCEQRPGDFAGVKAGSGDRRGNLQKAMKLILAALSISSIPIRTRMALRRAMVAEALTRTSERTIPDSHAEARGRQ